jgi:putative acetyltransferase
MEIRIDDLTHVQTLELIRLHVEQMYVHSPAASVFALNLDHLKAPDITVWTAWEEDSICGIGALRQLDSSSGEVKSMRTHPRWLRKGVGLKILRRIIDEARIRKLSRLSLETGTGEAFEPAITMYLRSGFVVGEPFAEYTRTDFNQFFHLEL